MTFRQWLSSKHSVGTTKRYIREINLFQKALPNAQEASYQEIMDYVASLRIRYQNVDTIRVSLAAIKRYFDYLAYSGKRNDHPCKYLRLRDKSSKDVQLQDLFSQKELQSLLKRKERYTDLKIRNQLIITLLIYQGLTTGEICRLSLEDIDLESGEIYITQSRQLNSRTLQLQPKQILLLHTYLQQIRPKLQPEGIENQEALVLTKLGTPEKGEGISYLISTFKGLFPERNLNPKTIRQSVIADLLKQGKDLRLVQVFAGHKYPSSTERYRQNQVEALKKLIEKYHPLA